MARPFEQKNILKLEKVTQDSVAFGDQLDLWGLGSWTYVAPDVVEVNLFELSFDSESDLNMFQADSFTLATLTFDTIALGTSPLDISINALGDS